MSFKSKPSVLFVCLGNICRSPLAEAAFRAAFMVLLGGQALALVWLLLPARRG